MKWNRVNTAFSWVILLILCFKVILILRLKSKLNNEQKAAQLYPLTPVN